jgi:predicted DNA binding protein
MWITKFIIKHDCILGNRSEKFGVSLQSVNFSTYKEKNKIVTSSIHQMFGELKDTENFVKDLQKDKDVIRIERKGNTFLLLEKAEQKAVAFHNPKIIFVKPVVIDNKGYETWEIGSWDKSEVSCFLENVEKEMPYFKMLKFHEIKMDDIFFPRLIPNLTDKQKKALELAIIKGYYNTPKKIGLRKLAKLNGISLSTYQQHLSSAEEKIIPNILSYFK